MDVSYDSGKMGNSVQLLPSVRTWSVPGIEISEHEQGYSVNTGVLTLEIPKAPSFELAKSIRLKGKLLAECIYPVFLLEHRNSTENGYSTEVKKHQGRVESVVME